MNFLQSNFIEIFQVFFFFLISYLGIIGFVFLNYRIYKSSFYILAITDLGIFSSWFAKSFFQIENHSVVFIVIFSICISLFFKYVLKGRYKTTVYFLAPACIYILFLFVAPILFEIYLSFHKLNINSLSLWIDKGQIEFVGLDNFKEVLSTNRADGDNLFVVLVRTFVWTTLNVVMHVTIGLGLALLLNAKLKFTTVYKTFLILPWAIPQLISILAWRGEFHTNFGYINHALNSLNNIFSFTINGNLYYPLASLGIKAYEWWSNPNALFTACCLVNVWLGFPFMMVVCLSGLKSISPSYYEAASLDGATTLQQFVHITWPQLKHTIVPAAILGMIWTFNNINVIYLMSTDFKGADILVTDLYRQSFQYNRYSFSAAYSLITFLILFFLTILWIRKSHILEEKKS